MVHGGTSFGWMNGASVSKPPYKPNVTSYDYNSAIDESGRPTPKYFLFRDAIAKATGLTPPPVPQVDPPIVLSSAKLNESVSLWSTLPQPVASDQILTMEDVGQDYGYILYRTTIPSPISGDLVLDELHDYALVCANGDLIGTLDRRLEQNSLHVDIKQPNTSLDILVENSGRVNSTKAIRGERKGITKQVTLAGKQLTGWRIYPLPMNAPGDLPFTAANCSGACFYRGTLQVDHPGDTFLDTRAFTKGFVWVNGHALGRIWNIGPQRTLYLPGPWLHPGANDVIVFDLQGSSGKSVSGLASPILGENAPDQP